MQLRPPHDETKLPTGYQVLILFGSSLSRKYREPLGRVFSVHGQEEFAFDAQGPPYEAYGYHPERPGDTPISFWGDHYIWAGKPRTPWVHIKELVNRNIFVKQNAGKLVPGQLHWTARDGPS